MTHISASQAVLNAAVEELNLTPDQENMLHLNFMRCMNMTGSRPSDAARSEVRALVNAYQSEGGIDAYFANFDEIRKGDRR
jgi:hypothetical protein